MQRYGIRGAYAKNEVFFFEFSSDNADLAGLTTTFISTPVILVGRS